MGLPKDECCSEIKVVLDRTDRHEGELKDVWSAINGIRNRPPVWATVAMTFLAGALGWFAKG